jgi:hypothetical protein
VFPRLEGRVRRLEEGAGARPVSPA